MFFLNTFCQSLESLFKRQLTYLVKRMSPIAGEWPHLTGPAPRFGSFRPFLAHQNMRTVDLIECTIMCAILCDAVFDAANAQDKLLTLHTRRRMHARHVQEIGHMFGVVDLVKERLLIGIYIHGDDKQISGFDRHWTVRLLWFSLPYDASRDQDSSHAR